MAGTAKRVAKARRARTRIAQTFAALRNGQINVEEVLRTPPECLGRVLVYDVVRRCPHLGREGANNVLTRAKVWPLTRMANLTPDERRAILLALPPRVKS